MFKWGQDIGIDLGTATVIAYVKGKGIVLREPSVVAVNSSSGEVLAVGHEARRMLGRTPGNIVATRPLKDGVISDYTVTEKMLKHFAKQNQLEKLGVTLDNVFLGQVNSYGELTIDIFDDKIKLAEAQERPLLLATIKKVEADLEMFSLQTDNQEAKAMYRKNADKMEQVINEVKVYLGDNF